jgi:AraC-like DNA-binding protein
MVEIFQNIRHFYDFARPCEELANYVEFFAEQSTTRIQARVGQATEAATMFASWTPTIYINLGAPYALHLGRTRYHVRAGEDVLLIRDDATTRYKQPGDNLFTVKFYPGGLQAVLGVSQVPLANQLIDLRRVLPLPLLTQLKQPLTFAERTDLMQQYLLRAFKRGQRPDHYCSMVHDAIGEYAASGLQLNTSGVAERLFLTSKSLNRYFHRVVGTSPKQYFSVLRARTALTAFVAQPHDFAPFDYGYWDRSHFEKAVRLLTGRKLIEQLR